MGILFFCLGKTLVFGAFTGQSRHAVDQALRALDRAPESTSLLVVDLPAASALAFPHAVRLERPEREMRVEILSLSPHFLLPDEGFRSEVTLGDDRLVVRALGTPYLTSYIERAYLAATDSAA